MFTVFLLGIIVGIIVSIIVMLASSRFPQLSRKVSHAKERLLTPKAKIIEMNNPVDTFLKQANEQI